uniref:CIP1 protein n=1 Tax=[Candida] sp. HN95 TaxID=159257 RepID=P87221_9ASCO|nr:CIP1 protein [[Candida] sp. HN95]
MSKVSVAVIGLNGFLGKPLLAALESGKFDDKLQFPIKAITRKETPSTDKVQYVVGTLDEANIDAIAEQIKGIDVIVELVHPTPELFAATEKLASLVKPKLYVPSQFGTDLIQVDTYSPGFLGAKTEHSKKLRALGVKVVDVITGFFFAPGAFLYEIVGHVGIDPATKTVVQRGAPETKIAVSSLPDIGYAVASIITKDPSTLPDTIRIQSDTITFQDVINRYEKDHNVKLTVTETISKEESLEDLKKRIAAGFKPSDFLIYLQIIAAQGLDKGLSFSEIHNELVNPGESLWKWSKY